MSDGEKIKTCKPANDIISEYEEIIQNEDATNMIIWVVVIFSFFVFLTPFIGVLAVIVGGLILVFGLIMAIYTKLTTSSHD
jgi:uncharacterized membrane protein